MESEIQPAPTHSPIARIATIAALIVLLILGAWGIITVAVRIPSILSSVGSALSSPFSSPFGGTSNTTTSTEKITVTAATTTLQSGVAFPLSWVRTGGSTTGTSFTVSYACITGISFDAPLPTGEYKAVPCNTPFNYTNATSQMMLVPHVAGTKTLATQISVAAVNLSSGTTTSVGTTIVSVAPKSGSIGQTTNTGGAVTGTTVSSTKGHVSDPNGTSDVSVHILVALNGGVQFEIANVGTKTVPAGWIFTAVLPLQNPYTYISAPQQALTPGGKIIYNLAYALPPQRNCPAYQTYPYTYGNCYTGSYGTSHGALTIVADPQNIAADSNRANNTAVANFQ